MTVNKWQMHRAGLVNFWYYDDEQYYFADGKLLLRGLNGSGKSVTMQSLVTVLLDGKIAASRLDPFGSRDRRMEDYLLGEKDVVDRDERTGYLYLEYKREGTLQYVTTGIGLKAKRGSALEFWGFVITDNRRAGQQLALYKTEYSTVDGQEERIPLTRTELERAIGSGGQVVRSQQDYMALVNKYVFGFASPDAYKDLMELLIQLRSPKLSKDFKPTIIHEILTESLPTLAEEELRPLSDTIENMEQAKQQIDQLEQHQGAVQRLNRQYDTYNRLTIAYKAEETVKVIQRSAKAKQTYQACVQEIAQKKAISEELVIELAAYEREQEVLAREEAALQDHDVFKAEQQKQEVEQELAKLIGTGAEKNNELVKKQRAERQERDYIRSEAQAVDVAETDMLELLEELAEWAQGCVYANHELAAREFERQYSGTYSFDFWRQEVEHHRQQLSAAYRKLRDHTVAKQRQESAQIDLDGARQALDIARQELTKAQSAFFAGRQQLLSEFYHWVKSHETILPMEADEIRKTAISLQDLYEEAVWQDVLAPVEEAWRRRQGQWLQTSHELQHQINIGNSDREKLAAELTAWRQHRDPEPPRHEDTLTARQQLAALEVPFVPFYSAVEFHTSVSAVNRERIESALTEMGLLDALIVPSAAVCRLDSRVCDKIIRPEPAILAQTLADYLYPLPPSGCGVSAADIDEVLRSILIDDNAGIHATGGATILSVTCGTYSSGLMGGRAPMHDNAMYIGQEARRRYRQQEMERLETELAVLQDKIATLADERQIVVQAIEHLAISRNTFPAPDGVDKVFQEQEKAARTAIVREEDMQRKNDSYRTIVDTIRQLLDEAKQLAGSLPLPLTEDAFETALEQLQQYQQALYSLALGQQRFSAGKKALDRAKAQLAETEADVDRLKGEGLIISGAIEERKLVLAHIIERLMEMGADEIKAKSAVIISRLAALPGLIKIAMAAEAAAQAAQDSLIARQQQLAVECAFAAQLAQCWQAVLAQEQELKLVADAEMLTAAELVAAHGVALKGDDRDKAISRLSESFHRENAILVEHRLTLEEMIVAIAVPDLPEGDNGEAFAWQLDQLRLALRRHKVVLEYSGRKVAPALALQLMEADLSTQRMIQSRQDQELYEEVILNSIGRIISKRIQNAEKWANQMNDLMMSLNTSSGLTFSLRWRPLTADKDEQMDTAELVELLRSDHRLLKEDDLQRVVRHFRSRIEQAKVAASGKITTFQQAVQEVLDFRRWFTFTLYFRREGQIKKELTNSAFGKFSGGEKAMAMYVPLFSAAYSRYREARNDAPYIISLDEAFAGVDENNIREMFDLVEKLGFNYIMNSQSLWGDYDTVAKLAIYELVRPKNAPFVTLIPYLWDGKVRSLVAEVDQCE